MAWYHRIPIVIALIAVTSCAEGAGASLEAISPQTVAVNETLRIPLRVRSGDGETFTFRFEGPELAGLERTARVGRTGSGGEFVWTPLASHVGTHEFTFVLVGSDGGEVDTESTVITVDPSSDSAPVFLRPGAGGTYDLERDPCVVFDIEVRDDDTADVEIRERGSLPEGAALLREGPKRARFDWCPMPDQIAASERWTIGLLADDGEHPPTEHDYVVVLRSGPKEGCPGEAPTVTITSPTEGDRIESEPGFTVRISATDDMGLRDAPLLYWSTTAPDDPTKPDVTTFEQVTTVDDGGSTYSARIPSLGLTAGAEQQLYVVASATDNDDDSGTLCDHRTDSSLVRFTAVGSDGSGGAPACDPCTASTECSSAVCAASAGGARCLESCAGGAACSAGTCMDVTTREGAIVRACGTVTDACDGGGTCVDDGREPNDSIAAATLAPSSLTDGQICAGNDDFYRIRTSVGEEVTVTVDDFVHSEGDLDLQLRNMSGTILESSAGVTGTETVSWCSLDGADLYARVFGFREAENAYHMTVSRASGACCEDDAGEDDDTRSTARLVSGSAFEGTICPGDDDFVRVRVDNPSNVSVFITFDSGVGDLDLELYGPSGTVVGSSRGTTDSESIDVDVTETGDYAIRVYGYRDAAGDYLGEVTITEMAGCASSNECSGRDVCDAGSCVDGSCTSVFDCPSGHECPDPGPGSTTSYCGMSCSVNSDCRSTEACKWFPEGRYCGSKGSEPNGADCGTFADCGGQRACLDWTNGYCARVGCTANSDCESGTYCVPVDGQNVCAKDCLFGDDICRLSEGYDCAVIDDTSGVIQWVCVPGS